MLGIVEEQHADRALLFMQWKEMDWPILVDSLNLLDVPFVPITLFIDEHGIVRNTRPGAEDVQEFLDTDYEAPPEQPAAKDDRARMIEAMKDVDNAAFDAHQYDAASLHDFAEAAFLLGQRGTTFEISLLGSAIELYTHVISKNARDARAHFRRGVAHRARFDYSNTPDPDDFDAAVRNWKQALEINPNQYIYRRRIQQYGPRLDKPYSFYDWVRQARQEITARGEEPRELVVEPDGAEYAYPSGTVKESDEPVTNPDPDGRITRDEGFIELDSIVVPHTDFKVRTARVHVLLTPRESRKAHWNNEAEPLTLWFDVPEDVSVSQRLITHDNPSSATSHETRRVEVEIRAPAEGALPDAISGYALYNVCEDVDGVCLYRRQDFTIPVRIEDGS